MPEQNNQFPQYDPNAQQFPQYSEPTPMPQYGQEPQSPYTQPVQTQQPQQYGQFDQQGYAQAQQQYGQFDQQGYAQAQQQPVYGQPYQAGLKTTGKGIGALVCGIIGLFFAGIILGIIATVLGRNGRKECDAGMFKGKGLATAGMVLGILDIVLAVVAIAFGYGSGMLSSMM